MEDVVDTETALSFAQTVQDWFFTNVLVLDTLGQLPVIAVTVAVAFFGAKTLQRKIAPVLVAHPMGELPSRIVHAALPMAFPLFAMILLWLVLGIATQVGWAQPVTRIAASLVTAWVVIRLVSNLVGDTSWTRIVAIVVWVIAALNILQLLDPTIDFLDSLAVTLGDLRISVLTVIKAVIVFVILLWIANVVSRFVERRVERSRELSPSIKVLTSKLVRIALIALAIIFALNSVGIDLSGLAIFSGAIGVGIGFGLQRIVANLISGVILLSDRSIKPGDVLEIGGTYGWIKDLRARYVSIVTRDGTEHLIPNEMLITDRVINWSYSNEFVRLKMDIGVHYKSDVRKAIDLCLEAARSAPRVLAEPHPVCFIVGFGDSSVDLQLRLWINDPPNGISNVRGEVFMRIWDAFHENGIEIPYPQRDLHLRSPEDVRVTIGERRAAGGYDI